MKHKNSSGHIYTPGLMMRLFVMGMGIFLAGMHAFIFRSFDMSDITPFLGFMLAFILMIDGWFIWYGYIFTTQTRMIVNADGIELQRGGAHIFVAWENISHFGIKGSGRNQQPGIYLYHKVQPQVNGAAERIFFGSTTDFIPIGQVVNIPLHWGFFRRDVNLEKLAQTDFGRDVGQYAGHLLNQYNEKSKTPSQRLQFDTRKATYVVGAEAQKLQKYS